MQSAHYQVLDSADTVSKAGPDDTSLCLFQLSTSLLTLRQTIVAMSNIKVVKVFSHNEAEQTCSVLSVKDRNSFLRDIINHILEVGMKKMVFSKDKEACRRWHNKMHTI